MFLSQTTYSRFADYRFSFRKLQIFMSQTTDFHFVWFRFAKYSKPLFGYISFYIQRTLVEQLLIYILSHSHGLKKSELTLVTATRLQRQLTHNSPMDSCHGNPSPMESVCQYFRLPPQLYFAEYELSLLRTDWRRSDGFLPRQPVSIGSNEVRLPTISTPSSAIPCCIFIKSLTN